MFNFVKELIRRNLRVFTASQAEEIGKEHGISKTAMNSRLSRYVKKEIIERLSLGIYCLSSEYLSGIPIHEYEIALALEEPSAIAYLSAINYHKLTDQISSIIYILTPTNHPRSSYSTYSINGITYRIIRTKEEWYFGVEHKWLSAARITVTDLERTLLDGLNKPKYCGGMREVLYAFERAYTRIDLPKIIAYALQLNDSTCKRLGWVLSTLGTPQTNLEPLKKNLTPHYIKFDSSRSRHGRRNTEWYLIENL